jgi:hypothetical protein
VTYVHGNMQVTEHWSGGEVLSEKLRVKQTMQSRRAVTPFYVAAKWGFVTLYDPWGWSHFSSSLPPLSLKALIKQENQDADRKFNLPPRFETPWNSGIGILEVSNRAGPVHSRKRPSSCHGVSSSLSRLG